MNYHLLILMLLLSLSNLCAEQKQIKVHQRSGIGLDIESDVWRGTVYTDIQGNDFNLRYLPVSITNTNKESIHIRIQFSFEYYFPELYGKEKFSIIPLPRAWVLVGAEVSDTLLKDIKSILPQPSIEKTLSPGEKYLLGIGTLYPSPSGEGGILPRELFIMHGEESFTECDWPVKVNFSSPDHLALGLKLSYSGDCMVIPCGFTWFSER